MSSALDLTEQLMEIHYVYALIVPTSGEILYVGLSSSPVDRYKHHLHLLLHNKHPVALLQHYYSKRGVPELAIVSKSTVRKDALDYEKAMQRAERADLKSLIEEQEALIRGSKLTRQ